MTMPECNSQDCANGRARTEKQNSYAASSSGGSSTSSSTSIKADNSEISSSTTTSTSISFTKDSCSTDSGSSSAKDQQGKQYWKAQYDSLLEDYARLQKLNEKLEDKLLNIVEECEKDKQECVANVEYEKSTLMADVNKLSTKLVDARIRLHDYEEKELLHAAECSSPCHKGPPSGAKYAPTRDQAYDPNLV